MTYTLLLIIESWHRDKPVGLTSQVFVFQTLLEAEQAAHRLKDSLKDDLSLRVIEHIVESTI